VDETAKDALIEYLEERVDSLTEAESQTWWQYAEARDRILRAESAVRRARLSLELGDVGHAYRILQEADDGN